MQITRHQLGLGIGAFVLGVLAVLTAYLPVAWVLWDWNPANWPPVARGVAVAWLLAMCALRWAILRVKIVEGNDDEN